MRCPVCNSLTKEKKIYNIKEYNYYLCESCGSIFIHPEIIQSIDEGNQLINYDESYWANELSAAKERAYGACLARMAEVILYSRRDINYFLDVGTGPGYFLDAVAAYLPNSKEKFYGIEKFPPPIKYRTTSNNYIIGDLNGISFNVDAGLCVEVVEHLTPKQVKTIFSSLAELSNESALYLINTGMPDYVLKEDIGYLDPIVRGHIVSYSIKGFESLVKPLGFQVYPIPGKTWAFVIEYSTQYESNLIDRIWSASAHNKKILSDERMGNLLYILGIDTARAYI